MSGSQTLGARFNGLSPQAKQAILLCGVGALIFGVVFMMAPSGDPALKPVESDEPENVGNLLAPEDASRTIGLQGVSKDLSSLEERFARQDQLLQAQASQLEQLRNELAARNQSDAAATLRSQVASAQSNLGGAGASGGATAAPVVPPPPSMRIRTFEAAAPVPAAADGASEEAAKPPTAYIPSGTMLSGVVLTGIDAPTGRNSQGQPLPVLARLKADAILPSLRRYDVREAFIVGSGYGDLSSERAYIQAVSLSMVLRDGRVVDVPLRAAAVGSDGRLGLRGRYVSKQGSAIARAGLAAIGDGIARSLQQSATFNAAGNAGVLDPSVVGAAGLQSGASGALDRLSQYYLDIADQTFGVIEVPAGREITFVVLEGLELAQAGVIVQS